MPDNIFFGNSDPDTKGWHFDGVSLSHTHAWLASTNSSNKSCRKTCAGCVEDLQVPSETVWPTDYCSVKTHSLSLLQHRGIGLGQPSRGNLRASTVSIFFCLFNFLSFTCWAITASGICSGSGSLATLAVWEGHGLSTSTWHDSTHASFPKTTVKPLTVGTE